jgi:hypothetical protein
VVGVPDTQVTALVLRQRLMDLLLAELSVQDFDEWLTESTWDDSDLSTDALQLARSLELLLAEFSSGVWTWPELRGHLLNLSEMANVSWRRACA